MAAFDSTFGISPRKDSVTVNGHVSTWKHHHHQLEPPDPLDPFTSYLPIARHDYMYNEDYSCFPDVGSSADTSDSTTATTVSASGPTALPTATLNDPWRYNNPTTTLCTSDYLSLDLGAGEVPLEPSAWSASDCSVSPVHTTTDTNLSRHTDVPYKFHLPSSHTCESDSAAFFDHDAYADSSILPYRVRSEPRQSSVLRRDSARRNNARIEIPESRNLNTIDALIKQASNEEEVKELKAQRRLLRNREAALASRQRRKRHTEVLEVKEKDYVSQITALESDLADMQLRCSNAEEKLQQILQHQAATHSMFEVLQAEKEEMAMKHALETGLLRQRIQYYSQRDASYQNFAPVTASTLLGVGDCAQDISLCPRGWDNVFFPPDSDMEVGSHQHHDQPAPTGRTPSSTMTTPMMSIPEPFKPPDAHYDRHSGSIPDQPVASGILFMLLLCGALVASQPTTHTRIPVMPDEVRAASVTVLDSLLHQQSTESWSPTDRGNAQPDPSSLSSSSAYNQPTHGGRPDRLGALHRQATSMSQEQRDTQLFAMTPDEYNSYTTANGFADADRLTLAQNCRPPTRNLAEALARSVPDRSDPHTRAEVYTRSLLWDRIPQHVIAQFKELVRQSDVQHDHHGGPMTGGSSTMIRTN